MPKQAPTTISCRKSSRDGLKANHHRVQSEVLQPNVLAALQPIKHGRNLSFNTPTKLADIQSIRHASVKANGVTGEPRIVLASSFRRRLSNASYETQDDDTTILQLSAPIAERNPLETYNVTWVHDVDVLDCSVCHTRFSFFFRRHHCRSCGSIVCSNCSQTRKPVYGLINLHRVCDDCISNGVWINPNDVRAALFDKKEAEQRELDRIKQELDGFRTRLHEISSSDPTPVVNELQAITRIVDGIKNAAEVTPSQLQYEETNFTTSPHVIIPAIEVADLIIGANKPQDISNDMILLSDYEHDQVPNLSPTVQSMQVPLVDVKTLYAKRVLSTSTFNEPFLGGKQSCAGCCRIS
ncbi:hypothetical protein THRCLA_20943 [Thraustotheca clavata]|uniref:FYVE-type domain-containing protein n=1 Tax=Thraustotheca clavata TaxID=74557 RepID=A0A1W0A2E2_9STRA|nr:hypothetical protein THRCLA_20943 [Thraustotheca clavata]